MRKLKGILVLILLLALLASPIAVLASDISGAKYYGTIIVSNNSTATTNVAVNCTISTANLINGGYLNSSANNCVVRSSAGADLPFMPSVNASYPWCIWVPSIGQNTHLADILYTANSSGGKIRYFPTATGMTTADDPSMELGDNFTIEQSGWVDTVYSANKTLIEKEDAFITYISANETITSIMLQTDALTYQVDSSTDDITKFWNGAAWVVDIVNVGQYGGWIAANTEDMGGGMLFKNVLLSQGQTITAASLNLTASANLANVEVNTRITGQDSDNVSTFGNLADFDARPRTTANVTWDDIGAWVAETEYESIDIASIIQEIVDRPGWARGHSIVIFWEDFESRSTEVNNTQRQAYSFDDTPAKAPQLNITATALTATGVESGEYTITTTANITHMWIAVDNVTQDTITLDGGASVPDNANDWDYYENMADYWHYTDISVNSTQVQYIDWEYDTIFYDSSGFDNDATPTFRTTSSDADVSAVLSSFLPIAEAKAPGYALEEAPAFIETVPTIVSEWDVTPPAGTFPLAGVVRAIASATDTPAQLPLLIIAVFVIIACSLAVSAAMRRYGSGSLIIKSLVITALMGVFIALGNFGIDFWMLFVFLVIAIALSMGSKQVGWQ